MEHQKSMKAKPLRAGRGKTRKNRGGTQKSSQRSAMERAEMVMPEGTPIPKYTRKLQFTATADLNNSFTVDDLSKGCVGMFCATTTTCYPLAYAVRLLKVKVWTLPNTFGSSDASRLKWGGISDPNIYTPYDLETSVVFGLDRPSVLSAHPPKDSMASFWKDGTVSNTAVIFALVAPSGSLIEVTFEYSTVDNAAAGTSVTVIGGVVGTLYHRNVLSGLATVVGLNTIA
jgi:hypothetical protein